MIVKKTYLLIALSTVLLFTSCFEDLDDNINPASTETVNDFIYRGLNFFYLYKADTPQLANDAFADDDAKNAFISSFESPEAIFEFLKSDQDRFSILVSDYIELENALNGITLSNGMEYGLVLYPDNSGNVFGYVRYVLPNTDAASKGLQRGIIFNTVNGQQLTENNFSSILEPDTYTIGLATYDGAIITATNETVELTKTEYTENPIHIAQTYTIEGVKVGYLMYNQFNRSFDNELNAVFGNFNAEGVTELILDLRYNGGGAVATATDLASMITGQFNGEVLYNEQWNEDRQEMFAQPGLFDNQISNGEAINSLNLDQVYILTSSRSASASELVINSLDPYINVVQIGDDTTGKFQASFLMYDAPAPSFSRSQANIDHTYAMLPLVFKTANIVGNTDYINGLAPDIPLRENYAALGILGDINEPLFAEALNDIFLSPRPSRQFTPLDEVADSKTGTLLDGVMVKE